MAASAATLGDTAVRRRQEAAERRDQLAEAEKRVLRLSATRQAYSEIDRIERELAELAAAAADNVGARALVARDKADRLEAELSQVEAGSPLARIRARGQRKRLEADLLACWRNADEGKPANQQYLAELRAVLHAVIEINVMHQKIVVIDEQTVLLGSLNTLSQSWTREVMLAMRGAHFTRQLLDHERAEDFAAPPNCGACHGTMIDLRRSSRGDWRWRCYNPGCPERSAAGKKTWTVPVRRVPTASAIVWRCRISADVLFGG